MKRRLTLTILSVVAATLVLAGLGTLLLARVGARNATEDEIRRQAESTADLITVGQGRFARITGDLQQFFCGRTDTSSLSAPARTAYEQARADLCGPGDRGVVADAANRVCNDAASRVLTTMGADVEAKRKAFCAQPDASTLDAFRSSFCSAPAPEATGAVRRRFEQSRRTVCTLRPQQNDQIKATLSKESILFAEVAPDGHIVAEALPEDLQGVVVDYGRLAGSDTVSGSVGGNVYALAPLGTAPANGEPARAVLIERTANPISDSVQWFLIAAGVTLLLAVGVAAWLSRRLTDPLVEATEVTKRIAAGDLSSRLDEHEGRRRHDEIDDLSHSINIMADSLERSRGLERQFLLSVSHDLRTPLTSIRGYAEAIADGAAPEPTQAAGVILGEARRLERLVKDLLDLAKLEARGFDFDLRTTDIVEVADDSVEGFRREVEQAGLAIVLQAPPTPVMADVDPDRLQQVVANLIENALKYASRAITVVVRREADRVNLEVADDGPGIAPEDLPHVFERLYVARHEPRRKETGSGLGLAIVRELVDAMGGEVAAEANSGGGTRMVVRLVPSPAALTPPGPATS